ncbi:MAG TPA: DHHA1 domain-containing protein, partial [Candidatus Limnocylindrales bacterium]|nr:DHHA1 domain-containing protein [Candidatus Limnocylindrales bacterium]
AAEELVANGLATLQQAAQLLGVPEEQVPARIEALTARLREAEKAAREPRHAASRLDVAGALARAQQAGDTKVVVEHFPGADAAALRSWVDELRASTGRFAAVAAGGGGGPALVVAASRDLVAEGFDAAAVIRAAAPIIGGGGGGRGELAQAGGRDASRLDEALAEATRLTLEALKTIEAG